MYEKYRSEFEDLEDFEMLGLPGTLEDTYIDSRRPVSVIG